MHQLEQFHYGQLVHHGKPAGEMRVLAKSPGITDSHINDALNNALLPPLDETRGVAWGVLRAGRGKPAYLTRTDHDSDSGVVLRQFVVIPVTVLKALAGNIQALHTFVAKPVPVYEMLGDPLPHLQLPDDPAPADDDQVDSLLDLLTAVKNNTRNIEPLLAAIVAGTPLVVRHAPPESQPRARFVQGLLALLPGSTRFGVSFLLHNTPDSGHHANIEFMDASPERDALVFDWDSGDTSGTGAENDYSRFIVGQMRLDTSLVIQQTERLTRTAGWRFSTGDSLREALDYASYRSKVDRSVENNMPVDVASVADILEDDPTLDNATRVRYARHLMSFALALEEMEHVEPVAVTMHGNPELQNDVYERLEEAVNEQGKGALVFDTLVSWLNNPLAPQGPRWMKLLRTAALAELDARLAENDVPGINTFLQQIQSLEDSAKPLAAPVLNRLLQYAGRSRELAASLLLLSVRHLPDNRLDKLLASEQFLKAQPRPLRHYLFVLQKPDRTPPNNTLLRGVSVYDERFQDVALLHLALLAHRKDRLALIDRRVLKRLVNLMTHDTQTVNPVRLAQLAIDLNQTRLQSLSKPAPRLILQILLYTGHYDWLSQAMTEQARDYYGSDRPFDYVGSLQTTFKETALSPADARHALSELEQRNVRDVPFLAAICGALEGATWSADLESYASRLMQDLAKNPRYMQMLPIKAAFAVLRYYARQENPRKLRTAARVIASTCAHKEGRLGLSAANRAYSMLKKHPRTRPVALEVIRQYVREADDKAARHMMNYYSEKLDDEAISQKLQIAYEFSNMMGRLDLVTYAGLLHDTVESLQHLAESYQQTRHYPQIIQIRGLLDRIQRTAPAIAYREMGDNLRRVAHDMVILGEQHNRRSKNDEAYIQAIVTGENQPQSILDVMRVAGGYLTDKNVHPFRLKDKEDISKPFGKLQPDSHPERVIAMKRILHAATTSRPTSRHVWTGEAIADEIQSRVQSLPGIGLDTLLKQTGHDWQRLADLIAHLVETSDTDVIQSDNSTGRKLDKQAVQPQSPLALLRFMYGSIKN